jgi:hypothetical protein
MLNCATYHANDNSLPKTRLSIVLPRKPLRGCGSSIPINKLQFCAVLYALSAVWTGFAKSIYLFTCHHWNYTCHHWKNRYTCHYWKNKSSRHLSFIAMTTRKCCWWQAGISTPSPCCRPEQTMHTISRQSLPCCQAAPQSKTLMSCPIQMLSCNVAMGITQHVQRSSTVPVNPILEAAHEQFLLCHRILISISRGNYW